MLDSLENLTWLALAALAIMSALLAINVSWGLWLDFDSKWRMPLLVGSVVGGATLGYWMGGIGGGILFGLGFPLVVPALVVFLGGLLLLLAGFLYTYGVLLIGAVLILGLVFLIATTWGVR